MNSVSRGVIGGVGLAWVLPVLVASCSTAASSVTSGDDAGARDSQAADALVVDSPSPIPDTSVIDAPACALRDGLKSACDGSDPRVVFYPPLACDPKNLPDAGPGADAGPCGVVGPGDISFTSAACNAFVDAQIAGTVSLQASRAPTFSEPADGDALTADEWSIFAWKKGAQALQMHPLGSMILPEAHALSPLGGDGYVIVFSQGCTEVLRAMTATTFWAPDPASWTALASLKGPVTVQVFWAKFDHDAIVSGPVASAPITITMKE